MGCYGSKSGKTGRTGENTGGADVLLFKLLIVGDHGVGRKSLILRFTDNTFTESLDSTFDFEKVRTLDIGGTTVKLQIIYPLRKRYISSLQKPPKTLTTTAYYRVDGIIVVYDVTNQETFADVPKWLQEIDRCTDENVHKVLVGNKCDMVNERKVTTKEAQEFADQLNLEFLETSAKNATNVDEVFSIMAKSIKEKLEQE